MSDIEEVLLQSVEWLVDHNQEIPADILEELKGAGVPVNQAKYANFLLEGMKTEVDAIKSQLKTQEPLDPPIVNIDMESISVKLAELIKILSIPKKDIKIPEQKAPVVNVKTPRVRSTKQKFIRDPNTREIISSETTYEYEA